ncbi:hypothetical protein EIP86_000447 [Pleurotus ostreatoroseus]|nr:hypothetical protein EIP86_000447 [Pleurotus ostreatoroseus]
MFSLLPDELLDKVAADLLPNTNDVRTLGTLSRRTVAPARRALFRDCYTLVGSEDLTIAAFIADLKLNPDIALSVRTLTIDCAYAHERYGSSTSLQEIGELIGILTGIRSLRLIYFKWNAFHGYHPAFPRHPTLDTLVLESITCVTPNASPFDILRLASAWKSVTVEDLKPLAQNAPVHGGPFSIENISFAWFPYTSSWDLGVDNIEQTFTGINVFSVTDILDEQAVMLRKCIATSSSTLEKANLTLTGHLKVRNMRAWVYLLTSLSTCVSLHTVAVTIPVQSRWMMIPPNTRRSKGLHAEVLFVVCQLLPKTVKYLDISLEMTSDDQEDAKRMLSALLTYPTFAKLSSSKPNLLGVRVRTVDRGWLPPVWSAEEEEKIIRSFAMFGYVEGRSIFTYILTCLLTNYQEL